MIDKSGKDIESVDLLIAHKKRSEWMRGWDYKLDGECKLTVSTKVFDNVWAVKGKTDWE